MPVDERTDHAIPAVSVIVPTHNRPGMLKHALQSLARQTFRDFEVLVVNDAGQDVSALVESFTDRISISLHTHAQNKGIAAARNSGIAASRGNYLAYLDDDDVFLPRHLEVLYTFLSRSGQKVAYTDAHRKLQDRRDIGYRTVAYDVPFSIDFSREKLLCRNITPVLCVMHERECLTRSGLFAKYLRAHEDWDLWLRIARYYDFTHIPEVTCVYTARLDKSSLSSGNKKVMRETWIFVRWQCLFLQRVPPVTILEESACEPTRLGPENPEPCALSIVLPLSPLSQATTRTLASLCAVAGDAQLVLVGSSIDIETMTPLYDSLRGILARTPLAFCNSKDIGRIFAANQGAGKASGQWLLFLEEDVIPQAGCIETLVQTAKSRADCGALGGVLHAPGISPLGGGRMDESGTPRYTFLTEHSAEIFMPMPLVPGQCLMIRRELFSELNGFDPSFAPAHYADADLCMRLAQRGFSQGIASGARLTWNKEGLHLRQSASGVLSRRCFLDRWGGPDRPFSLDQNGADWSLRPRLWPSDGEMPQDFSIPIPDHLLDAEKKDSL
ncbi:MAG: glycosyltransferase family 2 protein [Desulfovibrio sp.]|jgi:GT2 family glycosyltransferase|nr:glycosyltransferase family 2 protein [Desulfovibrio sp.]